MIANPIKTIYEIGEELNLKLGYIEAMTAMYNKSKDITVETESEPIEITENMVSGYDKNTIGEQELTVTYEGKTTTFKVTVTNEVTGISIASNPSKTTYVKGTDLDVTGGKIQVTYEDGSKEEKEITANMVTGYNKNTLGEQELTVTYEGKTTTFKVTVTNEVTGISIASNPSKTTYVKGTDLDVTGGKIQVTYEDGSKEEKEITANMVTGYDKNTIGEQELTVTYDGKTATFYIEVISGEIEVDSEKYDIMVKDEKRYICNIEPKTTLQEMKNNIDTNAEIEIYKGTQKIEDENVKLATGMKLKVYTNSESIEYTIVVTGDLNGDGEMEDIDLLKLARYKAGLDETLQGEYLQAANIYNDDNIADDTDLLKMARILAGLDTL